MEQEVVEKIKNIIAALEDGQKYELKTLDLDSLTRLAGKLAIYRASLSEMVADAVYEANYAYIFRRYQFAAEFNKLKIHLKEQEKMTDGQAERQTEEALFELRQKEIENRRTADRLSGLLDTIDRLVFVIHSRITVLLTEKKQTGMQNEP